MGFTAGLIVSKRFTDKVVLSVNGFPSIEFCQTDSQGRLLTAPGALHRGFHTSVSKKKKKRKLYK